MRHKKISLTDKAAGRIPVYDVDYSEDNKSDIERMKKVLKLALLNELTERQRYCIYERYFNNKKVKTIASELSLNPSTISRHIKSAEKRLKKIADCYA